MQVWACVTTRNRTADLDTCLAALWSAETKPAGVVVSDDSPDPGTRRRNREVAARYAATTYLVGPRAGVCANRNHAVDAVPPAEDAFVAFVDDDVSVDPDFVAAAMRRYAEMDRQERCRTILTGVIRSPDGREHPPGSLSFRGYLRPCAVPESVAIPATVFPRKLFESERWDEHIFLGYEEAELSLTAVRRGYRIVACPELKVLDRGSGASTLAVPAVGRLTEYDLYLEAARLYVGVKRYRDITPSRARLYAFVAVYVMHMTAYLFRKGALRAWPEIVRRSRVLAPGEAPPGGGRRLNILFGLHVPFLCGEMINAVEVAERLDARGHRVWLYHFADWADPAASEVPTLRLAADRRLPVLCSGRPAGLRAPVALLRLVALIRRHHIDVVHVFGDTAITRWLSIAAGMVGVPVVVNDYKMYVSPTHPRRAPLVVGTRRLADEARSSRPGACLVVEPPVDLAQNAPEAADRDAFRCAHGIGPDEILVVLVGRVDGAMKLPGILGAIEAMGHLDDPAVRLFVIGDGEGKAEVRARAEAANRRAGRRSVVVLDALVDPRPAYAAADIVLGMGHSALRGMAFGKPVVVLGEGTFSLPVTPETASVFDYDGFYGSSRGADLGAQLAGQLRPLVRDRADRERLGAFGRGLVEAGYDIDVAVDKLETIYGDAVSDHLWSDSCRDVGELLGRRAARAVRAVFG